MASGVVFGVVFGAWFCSKASLYSGKSSCYGVGQFWLEFVWLAVLQSSMSGYAAGRQAVQYSAVQCSTAGVRMGMF